MTTTISQLLTDPTSGLLPYLDTALAGEFASFRIRPYSFGNTANTSGYRLRSQSSRVEYPFLEITQSIIVGRMFVMSDPSADQMTASNLAAQIDWHIAHWSRCKARGLVRDVKDFQGAIAFTQDESLRWYAIVIRDFQMSYMWQK